jgi:hypothetical protein
MGKIVEKKKYQHNFQYVRQILKQSQNSTSLDIFFILSSLV